MKDKNSVRDCLTGKRIGNKEVITIDSAIDYVKKQGYVVSKPKIIQDVTMIFLLIILSIGLITMLSSFSSAVWWSTNWTYEKPITLYTNDSQSRGNLSVFLNVTWNNHMNSNFSDIRIIASDGTTALNYWFYNNTYYTNNSVGIWFHLNENISSATNLTLYMYYGNKNAILLSDINKTFDWADDFNGNIDLGKWNKNGGAAFTLNGVMVIPFSASSNGLMSVPTFSNFIVTASVRNDATSDFYNLVDAQSSSWALTDYSLWSSTVYDVNHNITGGNNKNHHS